PKTVHELKNAISAKKSTVKNHLDHLENVGVVKRTKIDGTTYWRPK
ncbi:MAG: ArsR family transcriptional regulator, partial [Candidatus Nanohalobium sp.]